MRTSISKLIVLGFCLTVSVSATVQDDALNKQAATVQQGKTSIPELLAGYREMIRREPKNPLGYTLAASVYDRAESKALFEQALAVSPDYVPARVGLARFLMRSDKDSEAFVEFQKALTLEPANKSVRLSAINAAVKANRLVDAKALAGSDRSFRIEVINSLIDESRYEEAGSALREFGLDVNSDGEALVARGRLAYLASQKGGDATQRQQGVDLMLEGWRKSPELIGHYRMFYPRRSLVQTLTEARRSKEVLAVVEKGISVFPEEYPLYEARWKAQFATVKSDYTSERAAVVAQVEELLKTRKASPDLLKVAALGYKMAVATEDAARIDKRLVVEFPYSMPALMLRRTEATFEKDLHKKLALVEKFNQDFVSMPMYTDYFSTLDELNVSNEELLKGAEKFIASTPYQHAALQVAEVFLRRKIHYDRLTVWLDRHMGKANPPTDAWSARIWTMKGKLLLAQGQKAEAAKLLRPLPDLELQGYSNVDKGKAQFYLAQTLEANQQTAEAMEMYAQAFAQSQHYIAEAGDGFKRLYLKIQGSAKGMDEFLTIREGMFQIAANTGIERGTKIEKPAPAFSMLSLKGDRVTLDSLRGKVAIVNFWATWCGPCIKELPHFQKFQEKMKNDPGVAVLAVTTDENRALVEPFIKKHGYTFTVLYDEGLKSQLGIRGIPATFVIDPQGIVQLRMIGFNANEPLVPYLSKLVDQFRAKGEKAEK